MIESPAPKKLMEGKPALEWSYPEWLRFLGAPSTKYDPIRDVYVNDQGALRHADVPPHRFLSPQVTDELRRLRNDSRKRQ